MAEQTLRLSALGQDVKVGCLYNYYHHEIQNTTNVKPEECIIEEKSTKPEVNYFFQRSEKFKRWMLGIRSHWARSIEHGSRSLKQFWFVNYLNEENQMKDDQLAQVTIYFKVTRRIEALNQCRIESMIKEYQENANGWATHLVEQVTYGAEFICLMRKPFDPRHETKESAEESIYNAAKKYFDQIVGLNSAGSTIKPPNELNNVTYTILSSLENGKESNDTFQLLSSSRLVKVISGDAESNKFSETWRPIEITLRLIPLQIEFRIQCDRINDLMVDIEQSMQLAIGESNRLLNCSSLYRVPSIKRAVCHFHHLILLLPEKVKKKCEECKIQCNSREELLKELKSLADLLAYLNGWLILQRSQIDRILGLLEGTQIPVLELSEETITSVSSGCDAHVFVLGIDFVADPLIEHIRILIGHSEPTFMVPVLRIASDSTQRLKELRQDLCEFANHQYSVCGSGYYVGLVSSSTFKDGTIVVTECPLYVAQRLVNENTENNQQQNESATQPVIDSVSIAAPTVAGLAGNDNEELEQWDEFTPEDIAVAQFELSAAESGSKMTNVIRQDTATVVGTKETNISIDNLTEKQTFQHNEIEDCQMMVQEKIAENTESNNTDVQKQTAEHSCRADRECPSRIAEIFKQETNANSQLISRGQPDIYQLNAKQNSASTDFRWFDIGRTNETLARDHKVIILMGATGCGKSTLINGMVNYILDVQWADPFRFKCVREDECESRNQAHSQTSSVTAYTIHHQEGMAVPYSITIIDTPGYGDTRGVARDKEITKIIHQFLTQKETQIDQIHAVCFVAASGDSRLTVTQRYILDSVLSIFGKDIRDNIRLLVTFADNADPPVVEACQVANFPVTSPSTGISYSKFNSSVLYASNTQQVENDFSFDELFWDMGQENFQKFFTMLDGMNGKDLEATREVIRHRRQLEQSLKDIEHELEVCLIKIENMDMFRMKLLGHSHKMEANKNYVIEKTELCSSKVDCRKGYRAYNCRYCQRTCKLFAKNAVILETKQSSVNCQLCSCPNFEHSLEKREWRQVPVKVRTTLEDMKAEFESNCGGTLSVEQHLTKCSQELNLAKGKVIDLLDQLGANVRSLDSTALRSNVLSPADYLNLMRSRVAEEQTPGYLLRLETLGELQQMLTVKQSKEHELVQKFDPPIRQ